MCEGNMKLIKISNVKNFSAEQNLFQLYLISPNVLNILIKKLYNRPRRANDTLKNVASIASPGGQKSTLLPPFDSWSRAFAASTGFAGAFGAREELGHQLRDVRQLGVGVQHVH